MPKYVLYYFDVAARAEPIRLLFHQANVEFEDRRIKYVDWPELKKNDKLFPFGQVPVLEIDGVALAQSETIARYVAEEFGLNGKTNLDKAKCDMICDGILDIMSPFITFFLEKDETKKAMLFKAFYEEHLPKGLQLFEGKFIPKGGFFLGNEVSRADFRFLTAMEGCEQFNKGSLEKFPLCKALCERVRQCPNIKKYLDSKQV